MRGRWRLQFARLGALVLFIGVAGLPAMVPGYNAVRQTVSEIGEVGSPAQGLFTAMLCAVAACVLVFAWALWDLAAERGRSRWPAALTAAMAASAAGVGVFSFPHPLHNVFGLSELIGYQAPLALALALRRDERLRAVSHASWIGAAVVWVAIALNLTTLVRHGAVWAHIQPVYGLVQRGLFAAWFGWAAVAGGMLHRRLSGQTAEI